MPANINSMFYAGEKPWHEQGTKVLSELTSAEAIRKAGLNWTVSTTPVLYGVPKSRVPKVMAEQFVTRRDDTGDGLGIVGNRYKVLQNKDAFSFFDAVVGQKAAMYHTAGALGLGERIWILAKLPGDIIVKGVDKVEKFLLLTNSHDGKTTVTVKMTPIRVVCQNTLNAALNDGEQASKLRHTSRIGQKVKDVRETIGLVNKMYENLSEKFNFLANKPCGVKAFEGLVDFLELGPKDDAKLEDGKRYQIVDDLLARFEKGKGNDQEGIKGTWWTAYNAIAEYTDYSPLFSRARTADERTRSLLFGQGNLLKERALVRSLEMARK
jgi:phage/plasmid-like protein (TIGR03299 family)